MKHFVLCNELAGHGRTHDEISAFVEKFERFELINVTDPNAYLRLFSELKDEDVIVVCGGDGTLNHFVNEIHDKGIKNQVYYHATGSGNDFLHDISDTGEDLVNITSFVHDLPTVTVKGETRRFINGVGYGIDGYCCEVGDRLRKSTDKPINYTSIAIKGLLFHFKPANAIVKVDGKEHFFKKAWICPTMHGRMYGGGMIPTPDQQRNNPDGKLSVLVFHGTGKLKTLLIFPSLFKGQHVKHKKHITILEGRDIEVSFDKPTSLQIDGETVLKVSSYRAVSSKTADLAK